MWVPLAARLSLPCQNSLQKSFSPILFFQPKLRAPAKLTDNGLLRLTGYFETKPERISFDMLFQPVRGNWLLFGLAVDVAAPKADTEPPAASRGERSSVEPAVKRDNAPLPRKASVPTPSRRPAAKTRKPPHQATDDTSREDMSDDSSGSVWSLWDN